MLTLLWPNANGTITWTLIRIFYYHLNLDLHLWREGGGGAAHGEFQDPECRSDELEILSRREFQLLDLQDPSQMVQHSYDQLGTLHLCWICPDKPIHLFTEAMAAPRESDNMLICLCLPVHRSFRSGAPINQVAWVWCCTCATGFAYRA